MPFPEGFLVAQLVMPAGERRAKVVRLVSCQNNYDGVYRQPVQKFTPSSGEKEFVGFELVRVKVQEGDGLIPTKLTLDEMWDGWDQLTLAEPEKIPWLAQWLLQ